MGTSVGTLDTKGSASIVSKAEERKVVFASSLGTVFEWYDFYLYVKLPLN